MKVSILTKGAVGVFVVVVISLCGFYLWDILQTTSSRGTPVALPVEDSEPIEDFLEVRFGIASAEGLNQECAEFLAKRGWDFGTRLPSLDESAATELQVQQDVHQRLLKRSQQYERLTQDSPDVQESCRTFLDHWAHYVSQSPGAPGAATVVQLGQAALAAGSSDPFIIALEATFTGDRDPNETAEILNSLPPRLKAAGYSLADILMVQRNRLAFALRSRSAGFPEIGRELVETAVAYAAEATEDPSDMRRCWKFLSSVYSELEHGDKERLFRACVQNPSVNDYLVHMLAGDRAVNKGWSARGTSYAYDVPEEAWQTFHRELEIASSHYQRAWMLQPDLPFAPAAMIRVRKTSPAPGWPPYQWLQLALRAQLDYEPAIGAYFTAMMARWGGTAEQSLHLARQCAAATAFDTRLPLHVYACVQSLESEFLEHDAWVDPEIVSLLEQHWSAYDTWADTHQHVKSGLLVEYLGWRAAVLLRNSRYAEARTILNRTVAAGARAADVRAIMQQLLPHVDLDVSLAFAMDSEDADKLLKVEEQFGTADQETFDPAGIDAALAVVSAAGNRSKDQRANYYFETRGQTLKQLQRFYDGEWVSLKFGDPMTDWSIVGCSHDVETEDSILISNLRERSNRMYISPSARFPAPFQLMATIEVVQMTSEPKWAGIELGRSYVSGHSDSAGGRFFFIVGERPGYGRSIPSGETEVHSLMSVPKSQEFRLMVWPDQYDCLIDRLIFPHRDDAYFNPGHRIALGFSRSNGGRGQLRISNVRIRHLTLGPPPSAAAPLEVRSRYFREAVEFDPEHVRNQTELGRVCLQQGRPEEAIKPLTAAVRLQPQQSDVEALYVDACLQLGLDKEALAVHQATLDANPSSFTAQNNIAWVLATATDDSVRDGKKAVELAKSVCEQDQFRTWHFVNTYAAALAEVGDFDAAVDFTIQTLEQVDAIDRAYVNRMLDAFQENRPWRTRGQSSY